MLISRRGLFVGAASLLAAPAIVRASSLMPVSAWADDQIAMNAMMRSPLMMPLYGKSPAMEMLELLEELRRHMREVLYISPDLLTSSS